MRVASFGLDPGAVRNEYADRLAQQDAKAEFEAHHTALWVCRDTDGDGDCGRPYCPECGPYRQRREDQLA